MVNFWLIRMILACFLWQALIPGPLWAYQDTEEKPKEEVQVKFLSFKILDEQIDESKADKEKFIAFFELKKSMVEKMSTGKLNAELYYKLVKRAHETTSKYFLV